MSGSLDMGLPDGTEVHPSPPCVFVFFGATGDLAARRIAPALYNLAREELLPEQFAVLGIARKGRTDEQFRQDMRDAIVANSRSQPIDEQLWEKFAARWSYMAVDIESQGDFHRLADRLGELDTKHGTAGGRLFYISMPPDTFPTIIRGLAGAGLNRPAPAEAFCRLVIEKPFGRDLASAKALNDLLRKDFQESQVFRIDHYLGKETVQNILIFRFANAVFEPLFNRKYVQRVEITASETLGMADRRGPYYNTAGALRDMVQNHMLQLMSLIAMDEPTCIHCDAIRDAKAKVLKSLIPMTPEQIEERTVRGQYAAGAGADSPAYCQENGVPEDSQTETFAAIKCYLDNDRWRRVPFLLRTGKRLAEKRSQIVVVFRPETTSDLRKACDLRGTNRLTIRIFPDEGITLFFDAKVPGVRMLLRPVRMDFKYGSAFQWASPEAYEHLLLDALHGDATLFIRDDEVEAAWSFIDSIRRLWDQGQPILEQYPPMSWGPDRTQRLLGSPYLRWQNT